MARLGGARPHRSHLGPCGGQAPARELSGHTSDVNTLAFSPDGSLLASGDDGQLIRVWNFADGVPRYELRGHTHRIVKLQFHPTQPRLFSISSDPDDAFVRIWDLAVGREIVALPSPAADVADLALDQSGQRVAITAGRRLLVWEASEAGRTPPARQPTIQFTTSASSASRKEPPALKVLGFLRRPELMRAIGNMKNPIRPPQADDELLVFIVSLPCATLFPTAKQYQALQARAEAGKKKPPGPLRSYQVFDPDLFHLRSAGTAETIAIAIAPLPFAFDRGGFKEGSMTESSSTNYPPQERARGGDLPVAARRCGRMGAAVWRRRVAARSRGRISGLQLATGRIQH